MPIIERVEHHANRNSPSALAVPHGVGTGVRGVTLVDELDGIVDELGGESEGIQWAFFALPLEFVFES